MLTFEEFCLLTGLILTFLGVTTLVLLMIINVYDEDKIVKKSISKVEKETKKRIEKMNRRKRNVI